jgi:hypothetical protein
LESLPLNDRAAFNAGAALDHADRAVPGRAVDWRDGKDYGVS